MTSAPVALFVYRRPAHTARTIASLKTCRRFADSPVYVFSDGPKPGVTEVEEVRRTVRELLPDATLVAAEANKGLARSITEGTTRLLSEYGRLIVIEDDLILAENFLEYMNDALDSFADDEHVLQVSGFAHDVAHPPKTATFLPMTSSWGWATWKRAWEKFDLAAPGARAMLSDPVARRRFDLDGSMSYSRMLERQLDGQIDSWAIKFYLSVFERNGLVLYPPHTLVDNEGFDGSGSHGAASVRKIEQRILDASSVAMPSVVAVDSAHFSAVKVALRRDYGASNTFFKKALRVLRRKLGL